ncbi:MAG: hypothetical protein JXA14_26095 [Anaerolineae bacterium]|nr:hypothetical protein [Anaerolineae bacterium]
MSGKYITTQDLTIDALGGGIAPKGTRVDLELSKRQRRILVEERRLLREVEEEERGGELDEIPARQTEPDGTARPGDDDADAAVNGGSVPEDNLISQTNDGGVQ